ncbi:MAG TPA: AsmA family protein, partial [Bacteroidales bacterium]|nr:AsmA family protein [Bacteroidales bacterium]
MKKFLKILFITLVVIFVAILTVPFLFKGKIVEFAKKEVNRNVRAIVDWSDVSVSLFKGFPDLEVSLNNLSVIGTGEFSGDTLVAFNRFATRIDLISAFSGRINVKSVILDNPVVRAIALKDGNVNWDITYPSADTAAIET